MISVFSISQPNPLARASYLILSAGLAAGILALPLSPLAALLPAVVIFGWSQIGGI